MPIVILRGYTQFIQKVSLARLLKATLGLGLKQAKDEVERLLDGDEIRVELNSMEEARAFLQAVTILGVSGAILDEVGSPLVVGTVDEASRTPVVANDEPVVIGPMWVMWGEPAPEGRAAPEDEAKARQVLLACQRVVDGEMESIAASEEDDSDDSFEVARFTDWLRSYVEPDAYDTVAADRADVLTTPALTQYGMYLALSQHGRVFVALRCM